MSQLLNCLNGIKVSNTDTEGVKPKKFDPTCDLKTGSLVENIVFKFEPLLHRKEEK